MALLCRTSCLLIALSLIWSQPTAGEFDLPTSAVGTIASRWITAFNSGDVAMMRAWQQESRSDASAARKTPEARDSDYRQLFAMMGPLTTHSVPVQESNALHLLVRSAKLDGWLTVGFLMSVEQPEKLESMWMQPTEAPQDEALALGSWQTFDELIGRIQEASGVPGIVAARLEDDRVVAIAASGLRCVGDAIPVSTDDIFHWGSVTKPVTASMVARLVEEGALGWDGRLGDLLPGQEMQDAYREVTIEQLLQHRGGLPAYTMFSDAEEDRWHQLSGTPTQQRATFVAHVLSEAPIGLPGESFAYSNAGYAVVAVVAERATGESYEDLMQSRVLVPLGMDGTGFGYGPIARHACGHEGSGPDAKVVASPAELDAFLAPAGDLHGTAGDLARFVLAHARGLDGRGDWLDPSRIERLHTPLVESTPPSEYAAGWIIEASPDGANLHLHSGSAGYYFAYIELEPNASRGMVVLMNSGALTHQAWASELSAAWREAGVD